MLKHILTTAAPGNGLLPSSRNSSARTVDQPDKAEIDKRDFNKSADGFPIGRMDTSNLSRDRADGLGPRTDARGDLSYRETRNDYSDVAPREPNKPDSRADLTARNMLISRIEHHRSDYPHPEYRNKPQEQHYANHRYQNASQVRREARVPQPLNVSTLNSSKHSLGGTSSSASPGGRMAPPVKLFPNGGLNLSRVSAVSRAPASLVPANVSRFMNKSKEAGIKEMLTSLGLLCLVSLLLALLSLIFLLKISPVTSTDIRELLRAEQLSVISAEEYVVVYEVTLALCALTLSLNLCCLLVCAIQFLFAVKLVNSINGAGGRTNKYLQKSAVTRVCAVGGFFISIPVFLTGIILYTFIQFHSTPAIVTSVFIGLGIIFCGCAMVHNVFIWQKEKTNAVKAMHSQTQQEQPMMNSTAQSLSPTSNGGYLTANGHITPANMSFHNTTAGTTYSHHPLTILPHQASYIIRPPTSTPPTPGDVSSVRPPRPPRPPASGSVSPPGVPAATLDLSHTLATDSHELSTLV